LSEHDSIASGASATQLPGIFQTLPADVAASAMQIVRTTRQLNVDGVSDVLRTFSERRDFIT